jgi:hypothetical protein
LPRGFGDRTQMLTNLLRAAVEYDGLDSVLEQLIGTVDAWRSYYQSLDADIAPLDEVAAFWQARLDTTEAVIDRIRAAAPAASDEPAA